jgi:hypothetical protein
MAEKYRRQKRAGEGKRSAREGKRKIFLTINFSL